MGTKTSGRPGGNPDIAKARKTGPITVHGKLKNVILNDILVSGKTSKLMKIVSKCKNCPLAPRAETRTVNNKKVDIMVPAQCKYWEEGKKKCEYPMEEQIQRLKLFFQLDRQEDGLGLQKALITQAMIDAEMNRKNETLSTGAPRFYTKEFSEQALKYTSELNKLKYGGVQKHIHGHIGEDTAKKWIRKIKKEDKEEDDV